MSWLDELTELEQRARKRLAELEPMLAEYDEVKQLVQRFDAERGAAPGPRPAASQPPPARKRPASKATAAPARRRSRRGSARPGERQRQVLALVNERPGITVPEIASELGVDSTGLYAIVRRLESRGALTKSGVALQPAAAGAS